MSIIIEGPDGAGKTTLINRLVADNRDLIPHPRFATSIGGPIDELARAVRDDELLGDPRSLYDRHPLFSEYIYGHEVDGRTVNDEFLETSIQPYMQRVVDHCLVVFCMPPLIDVMQNVQSDQDEQMPGVTEAIQRLYDAYAIRRVQYTGLQVAYDYTDPNAYPMVKAFVTRHMYQW